MVNVEGLIVLRYIKNRGLGESLAVLVTLVLSSVCLMRGFSLWVRRQNSGLPRLCGRVFSLDDRYKSESKGYT